MPGSSARRARCGTRWSRPPERPQARRVVRASPGRVLVGSVVRELEACEPEPRRIEWAVPSASPHLAALDRLEDAQVDRSGGTPALEPRVSVMERADGLLRSAASPPHAARPLHLQPLSLEAARAARLSRPALAPSRRRGVRAERSRPGQALALASCGVLSGGRNPHVIRKLQKEPGWSLAFPGRVRG